MSDVTLTLASLQLIAGAFVTCKEKGYTVSVARIHGLIEQLIEEASPDIDAATGTADDRIPGEIVEAVRKHLEGGAANIIPIALSNGDPGYFVRGHVDRMAFIEEVNAEFDERFIWLEARHTYQTSIQPAGAQSKARFSGDEKSWWQCKANDLGAFPCTLVTP